MRPSGIRTVRERLSAIALPVKEANPQLLECAGMTEDQANRSVSWWDSLPKRVRLFYRQGGRCHYCLAPMRLEGARRAGFATVDHVHPLANGGQGGIENCVAACWSCNGERGHLPYEDYMLVWRSRHVRFVKHLARTGCSRDAATIRGLMRRSDYGWRNSRDDEDFDPGMQE